MDQVMEKKPELKLFQNDDFGTIRTVILDGEPWFVLKDIASVTNQKNPSDIKKRHYVNSKKIKLDKHSGNGINIIDKTSMLKILQAAHKVSSSYKLNFISFLSENGITINKDNIILFEYEEVQFLESLNDFLIPFNVNVISNYKIGKYRVDYYVKEWNVAIEYDERNHENYNKKNEMIRENYIKKCLHSKIIRVSNRKSNAYNLGYIIKNLIEVTSPNNN